MGGGLGWYVAFDLFRAELWSFEIANHYDLLCETREKRGKGSYVAPVFYLNVHVEPMFRGLGSV